MGRAAALAFAREGARVAVLARDSVKLEATVQDIRNAGSPDAVALAADVTESGQVGAAFASLGEQWPHLNVLVNAVGPVDVGIGHFEGVSDEDWMATMRIGLVSAAVCVRVGLPLLRAAPGPGSLTSLRIRPDDNRQD